MGDASHVERLKSVLKPEFQSRVQSGVLDTRSHETTTMHDDAAASDVDNAIKNLFKKWPKLYEILVFLIGPSFFTGVTARRFIRRFSSPSLVLNAGSGAEPRVPHVINLDIFPFATVDVLADVTALPFADGTFDAVTTDQVLEHVHDPRKAVQEFLRILKPGGQLHIATPFVFPWHPSPSDFSRWTWEGLASLAPNTTIVEKGITAGPFSALLAFKSAFIATILCFGSRKLQTIIQYMILIAFFWLKFFDILFARIPGAELCAANVYVVLRKHA